MSARGFNLTDAQKAEIKAIGAPPYERATLAVNRWMVRKGLSAQGLADLGGFGRSTVNQWLQGNYPRLHPSTDGEVLTARIWRVMLAHPAPAPKGPPARMLETRNAGEIRRLMDAGLKQRAVGICYGAPASEKTFIIKCVIAEHQVAGRDDVLYIEASPNLAPLPLLQMLAAAAGTAVRSNQRWPLMQSLVEEFRSRKRMPLVVVDEAQHLLHKPYLALETLKELNNRTRDDLAEERRDAAGCGILLFGSHLLYQAFKRDPLLLAQWRRRITHEKQLTGMNQTEVLEVAKRELHTSRLGPDLEKYLLRVAREVDPFAVDEHGKAAPQTYYSPAKLATAIDRMREKRAQRGAA